MLSSIKSAVTKIMMQRTRVVIALGVCFCLVLFYIATSTVGENNSTMKEIQQSVDLPEALAYKGEGSSREFLEILLTADVKGTNNIFFLETSPFSKEGLSFTARQACSVEAAARTNPTMQVYLLVANHWTISATGKETVNRLLSYKNIKIKRILMKDYVKNTPLEEWWSSQILSNSGWPTHHMSDILRYLTLAKFGGIYLDLDVVVMKSLEQLTNFVGAEDWTNVAAGVLGFGMDDLGRRVADACLTELKTDFRGDMWSYNGPGVITRVLKKLCNAEDIRYMTKASCHGFTVYPPSAFYPIFYPQWDLYFTEESKASTMREIQESFAIHTWNKLSSEKAIPAGSQVPYTIVANKFCPNIYKHSGKFF
ncbi:lactosylceramide 4-alpha-galactosyltransferase [Diachasma alloeum]|uniref:lactosylceramide 4-alpha-galactosyltransferase n=1 Tax=Diachasma alloeum TaxID=454923 RepID=UPI0007384717|nr:lactosylceramide 4-alpha-galactosyltransferase [Diachasma alloeum]XP_015110058.1 lactosylceramide 4-alpha-galactosyltransferase [Diachasma alloeum]